MIPHALHGLSCVERFYSFPLLESTNSTAKVMDSRPRDGLFVIQAERQSGGRGQRGNTFFSDNTGGLWVSIISPIKDITAHFNLNRAISLAIQMVLSVIVKNKEISIKWPNDIYCSDRKICGILLENHSFHSDLLITGFGLNVNMPLDEFPENLRDKVTSILIETETVFSKSVLLRKIIEKYHELIGLPADSVHALYSQHLYKRGCLVEIDGKRGIFDGVESDGRFRLLMDGELAFLHSGSPVFVKEKNDE